MIKPYSCSENKSQVLTGLNDCPPDLKDFINKIGIDKTTADILNILEQYEMVSIKYERIVDLPYLFKCEIEYMPGNTVTCNFSFLFRYLT